MVARARSRLAAAGLLLTGLVASLLIGGAPSDAVAKAEGSSLATASLELSGGKVHAHLTRTSFAPAEASKVKLVYSFSPPSKSFAYVLTLKKGARWQTIKSVKKKGTFKGSRSMMVKEVFAGKPVKVGSYRLKLSADANSVLIKFRVVGLAPVNTALPTISGTAEQGQTLSASSGSWGNSPTSYIYQWQHCDSSGVYCTDISGATSSDYTAGADDVGMIFHVVVTAANSYGSTDAVSSRYPAAGTVSSGTSLVWSDEFNGPAGTAPDGAKWTYDTDCPGWWTQVNQELECYTDRTENVRQNGSGQVEIVARNESYGGFPYTSGRILTQGRFSTTYGRFEARIKIPSGAGLWPAFWMLATNYVPGDHWYMHGEIDVMENWGHDPTTIAGSIHGPKCTPDCVDSWATTNYSLPGGASFADDYHLYAVDWSPGKVDYYVDNALYATYTPSSLPSGAWVVDQHQPFFLLLNLAVGGWGRDPNASTIFPATMLVDYVRVYSH
ncbi:MAG: family 16 glycosylhydrolase [Gaiellaceae bacterium]